MPRRSASAGSARDAIDLLGATHSSEVLNRVPGVMVQRGSGQESLTAIRSPVLTGAGSCGAFLFLENGIPIRPVGFCNVNEMLEINTEQADAIEVLRGTGTALYGSNSVHGTINVLQDAPARAAGAGSSGWASGHPTTCAQASSRRHTAKRPAHRSRRCTRTTAAGATTRASTRAS